MQERALFETENPDAGLSQLLVRLDDIVNFYNVLKTRNPLPSKHLKRIEMIESLRNDTNQNVQLNDRLQYVGAEPIRLQEIVKGLEEILIEKLQRKAPLGFINDINNNKDKYHFWRLLSNTLFHVYVHPGTRTLLTNMRCIEIVSLIKVPSLYNFGSLQCTLVDKIKSIAALTMKLESDKHIALNIFLQLGYKQKELFAEGLKVEFLKLFAPQDRLRVLRNSIEVFHVPTVKSEEKSHITNNKEDDVRITAIYSAQELHKIVCLLPPCDREMFCHLYPTAIKALLEEKSNLSMRNVIRESRVVNELVANIDKSESNTVYGEDFFTIIQHPLFKLLRMMWLDYEEVPTLAVPLMYKLNLQAAQAEAEKTFNAIVDELQINFQQKLNNWVSVPKGIFAKNYIPNALGYIYFLAENDELPEYKTMRLLACIYSDPNFYSHIKGRVPHEGAFREYSRPTQMLAAQATHKGLEAIELKEIRTFTVNG